MQGITRFACQTRLPQMLNAFSGGAKRVCKMRFLQAFTTNGKRIYPERVCSIETRKVGTRHQEHEGRCDYACAVPAGAVRCYSRCGLGLGCSVNSWARRIGWPRPSN